MVATKFLSQATVLIAFTAVLIPSTVFATTLGDAASPRGDDFVLGNPDDRSYDQPGASFNGFAPFADFTDSTLLSFSSLNGGAEGVVLQFFSVMLNGAYSNGFIPGQNDSFGLIGSDGIYSEGINSTAGLGAMGELTLSANETATLALNSPESIFSSIDAENADGEAHILGLEIVKDGTITIPNANLHGDMLTFDVLAGDFILFGEDLLASGNMLPGVNLGDFDFQDMIVIVRGQPIPEPSTYLLFAMALGLLWYQSKRRNSALA